MSDCFSHVLLSITMNIVTFISTYNVHLCRGRFKIYQIQVY